MTSVTLREVKKDRTRRAIAEAALRLFAERGYDAVTVAEVASAADVAPRTVHRYFPDKEELLFSEDLGLVDELGRWLQARPREDPPGVLIAALLDHLAALYGERLEEARARSAVIDETPALRARELVKQSTVALLLAQRFDRHLGVLPDRDVRPLLWGQAAVACFWAGYRVWLLSGGDLAEHVHAARAALPDAAAPPPPEG